MKKKFSAFAFLLMWVMVSCLSTNEMNLPTPIASLSIENRKEVLTGFVQENGGCQLPCIFGITPGISDHTAVDALISYLRINSRKTDDQTNNINIDTFTNENSNGARMNFYENKVNVGIIFSAHVVDSKVEGITFSGQALQMIDIGAIKLFGNQYYDDLLKPFSLSTVLEIYGQPDQILIRPFPDHEGYPSPPAGYTFDFVLFYLKQGFVAEYIAVRAEAGSNFVGCATKSYITQISSWNPDESISMTEAIKYFSNLDGIYEANISEYKQLQDVTSLSITDFHNMYRISDSSECVQTPKELWPSTIQ